MILLATGQRIRPEHVSAIEPDGAGCSLLHLSGGQTLQVTGYFGSDIQELVDAVDASRQHTDALLADIEWLLARLGQVSNQPAEVWRKHLDVNRMTRSLKADCDAERREALRVVERLVGE